MHPHGDADTPGDQQQYQPDEEDTYERDPDDWDTENHEGVLADPEVPAIARELGLLAPPVHVTAADLDA
ncbi:hypothetical protein AB0I72_08350 [Nocardiopsis sp. NPDC049922]|uniref:hypothetical protein n=1 Tax=Nocardiopsis sp. NPDC049922 TaxID=3155157 RepID=UPI0033D2BB38